MTTNFDRINPYVITKKNDEKNYVRSYLTKYFTSSIIKNLSSKNPVNIILNLPHQSDFNKWILFDVILNNMKYSFIDENRFEEGDFLRLTGTKRNIICKFIEYVDEGTENEMVKIEFEDGLQISTRTGKKLGYEKVEPQKLSNYKLYKKNEKLLALDKIIDRTSKNNFELFDTSFIYVSKINSLFNFIKTNSVEGNMVQRTISWAKTNENGEIKKLIYGHQTEHFNCVVAPTVTSAKNTIDRNENHNFNAIIIDDLRYCKLNPDAVLDLVDTGIPILVFSNGIDKDSFEDFCSNDDFKLWHWGIDAINQLVDNAKDEKPLTNELYNARLAFNNFANKHISINVVQNNYIEEIGISSIRLNKKISEEPVSNNIFYELRKLSLRLSRLPSLSLLDIHSFKNELDQIKNTIINRGYEIPDSDKENFNEMISTFEIFLEIVNPEDELQKSKELLKIISENYSKRIAVITSTNQHHEKLEKIILHKCTKEVKVVQSSSDISMNDDYDLIIVTGWPTGKNLTRILTCNKFKNINFLVYPYQLKWLKNIIKSLNGFYTKNQSSDFTPNVHEDEDVILSVIQNTNILPEPNINSNIENVKIPELDVDILDFEVQLKERRRKAFQSSTEESVIRFEDAKLVDFYEGYAGVFSDGHKFNKVNNLMDSDDGNPEDLKIETISTDKLKEGDFILHFETDRDTLKQKTEEKMIKDGRDADLKLSSFWVLSLQDLDKKYHYNREALFKHLESYGLTVQLAQLRNWLNGETIAPKDDNNLKVIGEAIGGDVGQILINNRSKIIDACNILKTYRFKTAQKRREAAIKLISEQDLTRYREIGKNVLNFDIEEFGEATIFRVEDIDTDYMEYPRTIINKIKLEDS